MLSLFEVNENVNSFFEAKKGSILKVGIVDFEKPLWMIF
jgi:hypothetical protein